MEQDPKIHDGSQWISAEIADLIGPGASVGTPDPDPVEEEGGRLDGVRLLALGLAALVLLPIVLIFGSAIVLAFWPGLLVLALILYGIRRQA